MQAILLIYLYYSVAEGGLGIPQSTATSIVGAYGGTVYLSTVLGAWIADRLAGRERTLFWSAVLVMCGHIALGVLPGLFGVGVGVTRRTTVRSQNRRGAPGRRGLPTDHLHPRAPRDRLSCHA